MSFHADTGASPSAEGTGTHSVVESILAKLESTPAPEPSDAPDGTQDRATGDMNDAGDAPEGRMAAPTAAPGEEPSHEVVVDGRKERVTLGELRKGYSRQRDYTRKTAALAEQRRGLETERARLKEMLDAVLADGGDPELAEDRATDWERLKAEQPEAFAERRAAFDRRLARLERAETLRRRLDAEDRAHWSRAFDAYAAEQRGKLLELIPELADPARRTAIGDELSAYAASIGLSPKEQAQILDHRLLRALRDAAAYAKLRQAKASMAGKRVATASRTQAPRASRDAAGRRSERLGALKRNALRTGRTDDVVESVLAHLEEED